MAVSHLTKGAKNRTQVAYNSTMNAQPLSHFVIPKIILVLHHGAVDSTREASAVQALSVFP